jgi:hypothetical protein
VEKDYVARCHLRPNWSARMGPVLAVMLTSVSLLLVWLLVKRATTDTAAQVITAGVAIDAALLAAWQWNKSRKEAAIDHFYGRLNVANEVRLRAADCDCDERGRKMLYDDFYVFSELDNLEYAIYKYTNGCMKRELMNRALAIFENRCLNIEGFRGLVACYYRGASYCDQVMRVVEKLAGIPGDGVRPDTTEAPVEMRLGSGRLPGENAPAAWVMADNDWLQVKVWRAARRRSPAPSLR